MRCNRAASVQHIRKIWLAVLRQRCRHADDECFAASDAPKVGGRLKSPCSDLLGYPGLVNVLDVRFARIQRLDLSRIDIDADDGDAVTRELQRKRQAYVAKPDDGNAVKHSETL